MVIEECIHTLVYRMYVYLPNTEYAFLGVGFSSGSELNSLP